MSSFRLTALAVLALALFAFVGAPLPALAAPEPVTVSEADRKALHDQLLSSETMRGLAEFDAAGFEAFESALVADFASGKLDEKGARQRGYAFAQAARQRMQTALRAAPDADYLAFIRLQLATMKTLGRFNLRACYEFVEDGGLSEDTASTAGPDMEAQIETLGATQAVTARAGVATPTPREPFTDKEVEAAVLTFGDLGGDMAWLKAMSGKTFDAFSPSDRCDNAVKWLEALLAQPPAAAARLMSTP